MSIITDGLYDADNQTIKPAPANRPARPASGDPALRDLAPLGIPRRHLTRLVEQGVLLRSGRGLYVLASADVTENHSLAEACKRVSGGIVCLLSALRFHGLTTQNPWEVWMAITPASRKPKVDHPPLRIVRFSGTAFVEGSRTPSNRRRGRSDLLRGQDGRGLLQIPQQNRGRCGGSGASRRLAKTESHCGANLALCPSVPRDECHAAVSGQPPGLNFSQWRTLLATSPLPPASVC